MARLEVVLDGHVFPFLMTWGDSSRNGALSLSFCEFDDESWERREMDAHTRKGRPNQYDARRTWAAAGWYNIE